MKKNTFSAAASAALVLFTAVSLILAFLPSIARADTEADVERIFLAVHFYNAGDRPPTIPFMSIIFVGIPKENSHRVTSWREEIDARLQKLGGIHEKDDYTKIASIISDYTLKFIATGAKAIAIEFPKEKRGLLLHQEKKP